MPGLSYTAGPVAVGASYMDAEGFKSADGTYDSDYKAYGLGAAYTIAPGLVVQSDFVYFEEDSPRHSKRRADDQQRRLRLHLGHPPGLLT